MGFYEQTDSLGKVVRTLLMNGFDSASRSGAIDIPSGAVLGLPKNANSQASTTNINVGASSIAIQETRK